MLRRMQSTWTRLRSNRTQQQAGRRNDKELHLDVPHAERLSRQREVRTKQQNEERQRARREGLLNERERGKETSSRRGTHWQALIISLRTGISNLPLPTLQTQKKPKCVCTPPSGTRQHNQCMVLDRITSPITDRVARKISP